MYWETLGLNTQYAVAIKKSNNSESGCLITLYYFGYTYPSSISNLVLYWAGNNILDGVNSIHLGTNLQWIHTRYILFCKYVVCILDGLKSR